jgi:hypothetical protein
MGSNLFSNDDSTKDEYIHNKTNNSTLSTALAINSSSSDHHIIKSQTNNLNNNISNNVSNNIYSSCSSSNRNTNYHLNGDSSSSNSFSVSALAAVPRCGKGSWNDMLIKAALTTDIGETIPIESNQQGINNVKLIVLRIVFVLLLICTMIMIIYFAKLMI